MAGEGESLRVFVWHAWMQVFTVNPLLAPNLPVEMEIFQSEISHTQRRWSDGKYAFNGRGYLLS
jgi:hypothetical protein